jgi:hypothetical protein
MTIPRGTGPKTNAALLRRDGERCEDWMMNIAQGSRDVANIAFGLEALQDRQTQH